MTINTQAADKHEAPPEAATPSHSSDWQLSVAPMMDWTDDLA